MPANLYIEIVAHSLHEIMFSSLLELRRKRYLFYFSAISGQTEKQIYFYLKSLMFK